jgi:hypothetical protein
MTAFLAKLLGLWLVFAALALLPHRDATLGAMNALVADPGLLMITGAFTTLLGLAILLAHNSWSGGPGAAIVTLFGWLALIKGLLFFAFPLPAQAVFYQALHFAQFYYIYLVIVLAAGAYLTYEGFRARA